MKISVRPRMAKVNGVRLEYNDLVLVPETAEESEFIDLLGQPGSWVQGEIRLADGYGQHYILLHPRMMIYPGGDVQRFSDELTKPKSPSAPQLQGGAKRKKGQ